MLLHSGWYDVGFVGDLPNETISGDFNSSFTSSGESLIYVFHSVFHDFQGSSIRGAVYVSSATEDSKLLIEFSVFDNISSTRSSTIYMWRQGQFAMNKCCANLCTATSSFWGMTEGQFLSVFITDNETYINKILYSSISYSGSEGSRWGGRSDYTIFMRNGNITVSNGNITNNNAYSCSGLYCYPSSPDSEENANIVCNVDFSMLRNNTAEGTKCIGFDRTFAHYQIMQSNIIENRQERSTYGLIYISHDTNINSCAILNNVALYLFDVYRNTTIVKIINCTISEEALTNYTGSGMIITDDWYPLSPFINLIHATQLEYCFIPNNMANQQHCSPIIKKWKLQFKLIYIGILFDFY